MMHVVHGVEQATEGASSLSDPLRQSTLNAAEVVRADLVSRLGTDLTLADERNPLYKSGGAPNMVRATDCLSHRPWHHLWKVADGIGVSGPGRSSPEAWDKFVDRFVLEMLFTAESP